MPDDPSSTRDISKIAAATHLTCKIVALTHPGHVRSHNEDAIAVNSWIGLGTMQEACNMSEKASSGVVAIVADGMGGHAGGEYASQWVAGALSRALGTCACNPVACSSAIAEVNDLFYEEMARQPALNAMGTTVAGVHLLGDKVTFFNVGDSRVYRRVDSFLRLESFDDSAERQDPGDAVHTAKSGRITQAIGGQPTHTAILPHAFTSTALAGDLFLVCSDGLTDMLSPDALEECITDDLESSVGLLLQSALDAGGRDNISIVLLLLSAATTDK